MKASPLEGVSLQLEIESAILLQERKIAKDVLFHFLRMRLGIDFLQIQNDLLDGVLAVAALNNLETWAIQPKGAFRHKQHALLVVFAKATAGSEARPGLEIESHRQKYPKSQPFASTQERPRISPRTKKRISHNEAPSWFHDARP